MIEKKKEFFLGLGLMIGFVVVLLFFFMPIIKGKNGLDHLDNLYNSISKGSAYYIPSTKKEVGKFANHPISVNLHLPGNDQAAQTALLFKAGGAKVDVQGTALQVSGDLAGSWSGPFPMRTRCIGTRGKSFRVDTGTVRRGSSTTGGRVWRRCRKG